MNAPLVCLVALLSAQPASNDWTPIYRPSPTFAAVLRGQSPGYDEDPAVRGTVDGSTIDPGYVAPPTYVPNSAGWNPFQPAPLTQDPFLGQPGVSDQSVSPYSGGFAFGTNGPQPYRFGWTARHEFGILPKESTEGSLGNFGILEFDNEWEYTTAVPYGWIFSFTQQYNLRTWDGPLSKTPAVPPMGPPGTIRVPIGLPGSVHRLGWDFELATPANAPWSIQLGFNPSLNSDFERSPSSDAWNWDGRGIIFYRASPRWMIAMGAGFWDRVNDRVIPYAGAIWTPDDRWEWRLVFPEPRVSMFLGNPWGVPTWVYVSGEWHIEAYEIEVERVLGRAGLKDKIEVEDWRILFGLRSNNGWVTSFLELGWVFGRHVDFLVVPGFDVSSGFIARAGVQY